MDAGCACSLAQYGLGAAALHQTPGQAPTEAPQLQVRDSQDWWENMVDPGSQVRLPDAETSGTIHVSCRIRRYHAMRHLGLLAHM